MGFVRFVYWDWGSLPPDIVLTSWYRQTSWWRHQMETFSALLALCAGNSPVTDEFPAQRPATRSFDVIFYLRLNRVLHTPVGAAIEWAIVRRFSDRLASRKWLIRNQVLVNRLTTTSIKITKISWWEMLVNYQWNWCWLSWQIPCLTFTCKHVQFEWLRLLHPANESWIPSKFSSTN